MRSPMMIAYAAMAVATLVPPAGAADLQYGLAPRTLPSLGPVGDGRRLYVELNCYLCHGANGAGETGPNIQQPSLGDVSDVLKNGSPEAGMPSFGKYVSTTDIKNITAYLNSIGTAKEPKWWDWWVAAPKQ